MQELDNKEELDSPNIFKNSYLKSKTGVTTVDSPDKTLKVSPQDTK